MNDKMTFFSSYYTAIMKITDPLERLKAFETICGYGITGEIPEDLTEYNMVDMLFDMAKPVIDNNEKSRNGGSKGGKATSNNALSENDESHLAENEQAPLQKNVKPPCAKCASERERDIDRDSDIDIDTDRDSDKDVDKKKSARTRFVPPTVPEVQDYCKERQNGIDAEAFVAYYASKGWKVGREPMKDWKQAVITWERRRKEEKQNARSGTQRSELDAWASA